MAVRKPTSVEVFHENDKAFMLVYIRDEFERSMDTYYKFELSLDHLSILKTTIPLVYKEAKDILQKQEFEKRNAFLQKLEDIAYQAKKFNIEVEWKEHDE